MSGLGPILPLSKDDQRGYYALTPSFKEQIQQNFKNLMLTSPGERAMNSDFGVGLRRFLFEPRSNLVPKIKQRIMKQVQKYMPYIKIIGISFDERARDEAFLEESHMLSVRIRYEVPDFNIVAELILHSEETN